VTRVTVITALAAMKRAVPVFLVGLLTLLAAGCSSSDQTAQAPDELAPTQTKEVTSSIAMAPVAAPGSVSSKMGKMLAGAAKEKSIPIKDSDKADYTVRGYLVASPEPEGTKVSYIWDVTDSNGKRAHRFSGEEMIDKRVSGDPWAAVEEKAMRKIAVTTADKLYQWLPKKKSPTRVATTGAVDSASARSDEPDKPSTSLATASDASGGEIAVAVPDVTGAPGDGNSALAKAMRKELASRGLKLAESRKPNSYTVRGTVKLGGNEDGKQPITIRWLVLNPKGKPLKSAVVQSNKIKAGSLDGSWGRVAEIAAAEAAKSVTKILPEPTS